VLLSRYAGQDDICIGSPIANRNRAETEQLIGCFVNTLVLRTRIDGDAAFDSLLAQVRATTLDAYAHQDLPFEQLVEHIKPERQTSHAPLFQVMLILQNAPMDALSLPGLTLRRIDADSTTAKFDLTLNLTETEGRLVAGFEYNTDLFDRSTIARMAGHFTGLLAAIAADPACRVADLEMLGTHERQQLLAEWNDTRAVYPDACVHQLFEAQVRRTPDATALVFEGTRLSYAELNARANQLAHYLRAQGVGPDVLVGISLERGPDLVVGLLGILKAGGAYVPLDPAYPPARIAYTLADAKPALCLDGEWPELDGYSNSDPAGVTEPGHLAYVIYTSGSTGKPKGVAVTHASLRNFLHAMRAQTAIGKDDVLVGVTSLSFDIAALELYLPLTVGATSVLAPRATAQDPQRLLALLEQAQATMLQATPSTWRMLLAQGWPVPVKGRALQALCGGEALSAELAGQILAHTPVLWNLYGPTETTVWSAACRVQSAAAPSIGHPIANTRIHILDAQLQPLPAGVAGELHIAGDGLARGYLHRPDLTAEKFIPDPFSAEPGARMYCTGDLARYRADGSIEYLGRIDQQVKLRGFRIELGEIEAALLALPAIREAVVVAREDQLVAYLVGQDDATVRGALLQSLPEYMVPAHFMFLDALPLTPNGKIDRKALPAPGAGALLAGHVAPRNEREAALARIWSEVLKRDQVGVHDNFFALGGHSLLATQVISQIRTATSVELPLRALFEQPTVAGLAQRMAELAPGQHSTPIMRADRTRPLPLSFSQQRLWFLDQLEGANAFYNMPLAVRMTGKLDEAALHRAFNEIVRRHEALRTHFAAIDGQAVQIIADQLLLSLPITDLSHLRGAECEAKARQLIQDEANTPFQLASGPLIRVSLIRLTASEHIALITLHHIVSDGWSMSVMFNELTALYGAFARQQPSPLPELAIQYADYAQWQQLWLSGDVQQQQLGYWIRQLQGGPRLLTLATDRPRPAQQSHRGALHRWTVDAATTAALHALGRETSSTLFMTLAAAFNVLLSRYAGQNDIQLGTFIANRQQAETEGLIGFFVNTLVLRTRLDPEQPFLTLLQQVRGTTLDAYANQDVAFEHLLTALNPSRDASYSPLFQAMLILQNTPAHSVGLSGLTLQPLATARTHARFDLTLEVTEQEEQLDAFFEYNTDLFDATTIARMARHLTVLLGAIGGNPSCRVMDLPMFSTREQHQMLVEWNDTRTDYHKPSNLQQMFEAQALRSPSNLAVIAEDRQLTYAELNARANQLAHYLRERGVGPDVLVGICVERSVDMITGLLGILKAGGAYLPLDPAYPAARLAYMLADAGPALILTQQGLLDRLPVQQADIARFCLDSQWPELSGYDCANPRHMTQAEHLAYVIYTSGSSGQPKGVLNLQRNVVHHVLAHIQSCDLSAADRVLQFSSLNFDASVEEIFPPLMVGAAVVLRAVEFVGTGADFSHLISSRAISVLDLPTALWHQWTDELAGSGGSLAIPSCVRLLIVGGEKAALERYRTWSHLPGAADIRWINTYGPTEATISCTNFEAPPGFAGQDMDIPIGRPIADIEVYLLDPQLQPVPVGVPGELHIAGAGLARGYLNRPALTAEKFIPNPFSTVAGSRMYKSGDLARYLPDGSIDYLGRIDNQVKVRGFRIELGEIETALLALPQLRDAVVLAREDVPGDRRLVAYAVPHDTESTVNAEELRAALAHSLPDYMVPSHVVMLVALPLTPNGKIDRAALPAPVTERSDEGYVAPRTDVEAALARIWADLLKLDRVGIHDNFFALGGHSLLATQAISRIRTSCQADLPLRALFEQPTVEGLAQRIHPDRRLALAPVMTRADRNGPLPLSFAQQRLWFLDQFEGNSAFYNMPAAVRLVGQLDANAMHAAINEIVRRHDTLRTHFVTAGDVPQQVVADRLELDFPLTDLRALPHAEREAKAQWLAADEARTPFTLSTGPLIRVRLIRLDAHEHIVLFTVHHIVSDGWSMGVMIHEVAQLYPAFAAGQPSPLPELAIQYADFAQWQRQWLSGDELERQLAYWRKQLEGAPSLLNLPTDRPRPLVQNLQGATSAFTIAPSATSALRGLATRTGSTLFMALAAAFNVLLSRYSSQDDICIGMPVANRTHGETEPLIGFFVNTLVLRSHVDRGASFLQLLQQVRAATLDAYAHQDLPFEQLVEHVKPERHTGHTPLFQVMLILQNAPMGEIALPGLRLQPIEVDSATSKFDLRLSVTEDGDHLSAEFEYSTELFDASTMTAMGRHFTRLLDAVSTAPEVAIGMLPLLDEEERQANLAQWESAQGPFAATRDSDLLLPDAAGNVLTLFERAVMARPGAIAVRWRGQELAYEELDRLSNQVANGLLANGAKPATMVALLIDNPVLQIVATLGSLKAGCVFASLNVHYPKRRLLDMVGAITPEWLLTESACLPLLEQLRAEDNRVHQMLVLDGADAASQSVDRPAVVVEADHPCYVYFTSGSTGTPKAVLGRSGGLAHFVQWEIAEFGIGAGTRVSQLTNPSFDVYLRDVLSPLCAGATVCIPPSADVFEPSALAAWLVHEEISLIHCVPSVFRLLLAATPEADRFPALRFILLAGEPVLTADANAWIKVFGARTQLVNLYGPTETTLAKFFYRLPTIPLTESFVPIGKPMRGAQAIALKENLEPCAAGEVGEIHIRTPYRSAGYFGRQDLTDAAFIANPYSPDPADRLYKTGDLGVLLADGNMRFMGRKDSQVKIRGMRIELGEIETVLAKQANIGAAVVLAQADPRGDQQLVAYIVGENGSVPPDSNNLRAMLLPLLPEYMVPNHFVVLERLPLSPNGKVDRKALPRPDMARPALAYVAPRTATEQDLAQIWADILQVERVGIHDNFFALGGHSLLATQVVSKLRAACQIELPLRSLFETPTVEGVAKAVDAARAEQEQREQESDLALAAAMQADIDAMSDEEIEAMLIELKRGQMTRETGANDDE